MSWAKSLLTSYRLCVTRPWWQRSLTTATAPLYFRVTQVYGAEPLKKKKKLDPMVVRQKEERKKRKIEKAIRRLEKNAGQLKPIDELEVPRSITQEMDIRKRAAVNIPEDVSEERVALSKEWNAYKYKQHLAEVTMLEKIIVARDRALEELKQESEELWLEAIQVDQILLPFKARGPVSTPPIKDYDAPDGEYYNITKKWD